MALIEVDRIRKQFRTPVRRKGSFGTLLSLIKPDVREVTAVEEISFTVERGESVAYLGPNGAGKSTTIKMLTGILEPSAGRITVGGLVPHQNRKKNSYQIGAVFGQRSQLMYDLPVQDSFDMLRYMYGVPKVRYKRNLEQFTHLLEVAELLNRPVRTLSLGQRMRCELIAALLHDPEILFLDEPTIGLDVVAKERIRAFIEQINREKQVTIVLTTHDLQDIEQLCPRIMIIDEGKLIYDGGLNLIKQKYATERQIRLVLQDTSAAAAAAGRLKLSTGLNFSQEGQTLRITYDQRLTDTSELLRTLLAEVNPRDLTMKDESIDALISRIYREGIDAGIEPELPVAASRR